MTLLNPARLARFSDWARTLPPRPLPRTVTPVPGEFHLDYVRRLAHANHLEFLQLCRVLDDPAASSLARHRWKELEQERLAAAAGQPLARITRLCWPDAAQYNRDPEGFRRGLRPACYRCTARHHAGAPILCQLPEHITICRRHRRWIGPDVQSIADQHDLRPFPEYLTAQRRHQRLHQQHRHATGTAWQHAEVELHRRLYRQGATTSQQPRLARFCPDLRPSDHLHHPGVAVALYPDLVRLTSLLLATTPVDHHPSPDRRSIGERS